MKPGCPVLVEWPGKLGPTDSGIWPARVLEVVKNMDKVDPSKVNAESCDFTKDLGLDSLDTVEVVMAFEEEFQLEIPDDEADKIDHFKNRVKRTFSKTLGRARSLRRNNRWGFVATVHGDCARACVVDFDPDANLWMAPLLLELREVQGRAAWT